MIEVESKFGCTQFIDFNKMNIGSGYPTDVDGFIEYHEKCFIFIELKYGDTELKRGQALAYIRLCDNLGKVKPTIFIISTHNSQTDIVMADTKVKRYRYNGQWHYPNCMTTKQLVDRFIAWADGRKDFRFDVPLQKKETKE